MSAVLWINLNPASTKDTQIEMAFSNVILVGFFRSFFFSIFRDGAPLGRLLYDI